MAFSGSPSILNERAAPLPARSSAFTVSPVKGLMSASAIQSSALAVSWAVLRWRFGGSAPPSTRDMVTEISAMPSAMQWWMRTMSALPVCPSSPTKFSIRCICHSGRRGSRGCMASSPTRSCSARCMLWPGVCGSFSRSTWAAMSNWRSFTQVAPAASSTTRWQKRGYCSRRCCTRSHRLAQVMPGTSDHTPLIIMRLLCESMRSQAVSTLLMRSPERPSIPVAARRMVF